MQAGFKQPILQTPSLSGSRGPSQAIGAATPQIIMPANAPPVHEAANVAGNGDVSPNTKTRNIQEHYNKASSVCGHIDDLVAALTELYEDNAKWKQKYINAKKSHFSKFFGASSTMLIGNTFREWKRWSFECESERKIVNLQHDLEDQKKGYEKQLAQLEDMHDQRLGQLEQDHKQTAGEMQDQIDAKNAKAEKLGKERDIVQKKGDKIYKVMQSLKGQLLDCDECDPNVFEEMAPRSMDMMDPNSNFDFLKHRLHDLLNQVDPKYVPPLGSLSLMPPPHVAGGPAAVSGTTYQIHPATPTTQPKTLQAPALSMSGMMLPPH